MVGMAEFQTAKRQMPIIDPAKRAQIFRRMHEIKTEIIETHQNNTFIVSLAKSFIDGTIDNFFRTLERHTLAKKELTPEGERAKRRKAMMIQLLQEFYEHFQHELQVRGGITNISRSEYEELIATYISRYQARFIDEVPYTFEVILSAIKMIPKVASGTVRTNVFASTLAWTGGEVTSIEAERIVLVLSGGSAKGVFYTGFLKAIQEAGFWPDLVIGTSAGAIAAAALGTGKGHKELEKIFSRFNLVNIFHPILALVTPIITLGKGIIGTGLGKLLKNVLGNRKMSDLADVFVISSALWPRFGKVIFGSSSSRNGNLHLSSDIPAWKAVLASAAMPGLIPHVKLKGNIRLERLAKNGHEPETDGADFSFVTLNDGGIDENLGVLTADYIIKKLGGTALVISVNLGNYNPQSINLAPHISLSERLLGEQKNLEASIPKYIRYSVIFYRALVGWFRQEKEHFINTLSPIRAFRAYEETAFHNVAQSMSLVSGEGMAILVNPNANGSLGKIKLTSFAGMDVVEDYGYEIGKKLTLLLLGPS